MNFKGEITARIVDARFAAGGRIAQVLKRIGDTVNKGTLIASLDRKILQSELDRQLADYDKVRADFDGFAQKYPDPGDDNKYTKAEKQAALNASVKDVEIAKANLDLCDLISPCDGLIIDDSGIIAGQNVTPASGSVKIIDTSSYLFEFDVEQNDIPNFVNSQKCTLKIEGLQNVEGGSLPVYSDGKNFIVRVKPANTTGFLMGMAGEVEF